MFLTDSGSVYLDEQDQLTMAQMNATGEVDIRAVGNIDSSAGLTSDFGLTLLSSLGNITLGEANLFTGPINMSATSGSIALVNTVDTMLADVSANNLSVTASGNTDCDFCDFCYFRTSQGMNLWHWAGKMNRLLPIPYSVTMRNMDT